ncbi:phosphotransferase family protein [Nocardioides sp. LHD-245]|uniref:phosphotransferase family protein n=1 Tax=Nocardioides sp. LHD-245 TaxID=3051387 RepID=UPI0027E1F4C7|nr:phosphotransferase family protein [Nocardioides sp. LHD-245]
MSLDHARFVVDLDRWAVEIGGAGSTVAGLAPMPGNAGLSFGFDLHRPDGAPIEPLVIRLAPPGVRRRGNTDVLRQVPLLAALAAAGVPTAPVVWSSGDEAWFGTDAMVQRRLDALPLHMTDPDAGIGPVGGDVTPYLDQAVDVLAAIHAVDPAPLASWGVARSIVEEVDYWTPLLARMPEEWADLARGLRAELLASDPGDHRVGVFHGDYQTHNILYRADGRLSAVIDWEIAGIGAVGLDIGWLAMMVDASCWYAARREAMLVRDDPARLRARYEAATGRALPAFDWYEALACYRYGVIAAHNLYLHRSGRRVDPVSDLMGLGVPHLLERGLELCAVSDRTDGGMRVHGIV